MHGVTSAWAGPEAAGTPASGAGRGPAPLAHGATTAGQGGAASVQPFAMPAQAGPQAVAGQPVAHGAAAGALVDDRAEARQAAGVVQWLRDRFKVPAEMAARITDHVHEAAEKTGLSPALLLAVIGVESRFQPAAQAKASDGDRHVGLMQLSVRWHAKRFSSPLMYTDPRENILAGAALMSELVRAKGSTKGALAAFNGSTKGCDAYCRKIEALQEEARVAAERDAAQAGMRSR